MSMPATALAIVFAFLPVAAQSATVWKCKDGDRVIFSDAPCPSTGAPIEARRLQPNVVRAHPVPQPATADTELPRQFSGGMATSMSAPQGSAGVCPSDQEIRNMEVSARSATRSAGDVKLRQDEIRRARQCQRGQGNYTANDWQTSREAQAAQGSGIDRVRGAAKARVEDMHIAADPLEGDRIQRERIAKLERARALAAAQTAAPPPNTTITSCDNAGCWTSTGQRLQRIQGTNQMIGPRGTCRVVGTFLQCP